MEPAEITRALAAATSVAIELGLAVNETMVLHNSNRIAVRLLPCDTLVRVIPATPRSESSAAFELELARLLEAADAPVAVVDPRVQSRVYSRDGFAITFWMYYEPAPGGETTPADYARALDRYHSALRSITITAPSFTSRVADALAIVEHPSQSPGLSAEDRAFLVSTLRSLEQAILARGATMQLLHGEPHPGNLLRTTHGMRFIDLETCCIGPVEFDLAHGPVEAGPHYPGADPDLLHTCRLLTFALVASWRADKDDQFPNGRAQFDEFMAMLREG